MSQAINLINGFGLFCANKSMHGFVCIVILYAEVIVLPSYFRSRTAVAPLERLKILLQVLVFAVGLLCHLKSGFCIQSFC